MFHTCENCKNSKTDIDAYGMSHLVCKDGYATFMMCQCLCSSDYFEMKEEKK